MDGNLITYISSITSNIARLFSVVDTPYTKTFFTTDGTKPNPFQIGVSGRESTFKYKAPFQLKEGKRTIKVIAISR